MLDKDIANAIVVADVHQSTLYKYVNTVVNDLANPDEKTDPGQKTYRQLAQSFRIPYWDYALPGALPHVPNAAQNDSYPVKTRPKWKSTALENKFKEDLKARPNPLFASNFQAGTPVEINKYVCHFHIGFDC